MWTTILLTFLTVVLVVNCIFLVLLVLIQLPKKEAGAGMAFGGAATDTLFGAGSGNVLTKATKYSAGLFMGMSLLLAIMNSHAARKSTSSLDEELQKRAGAAPVAAAPATPAPAVTPSTSAAAPALLLTSTSAVPATATAPAPTNPPAAQ